MPIRVLIAGANLNTGDYLAQVIGNTLDMKIIGQPATGLETIQLTYGGRADVILIDALIAHPNAIETIREIMDVNPLPIVVCAPTYSPESDLALEAVKAGALAVVRKPDADTDCMSPDHQTVKELVNTVRAMSSVHVIRHPKTPRGSNHNQSLLSQLSETDTAPKIVSIVASTGGPQTLGEIVKDIPSNFSLPIVIVQHITPDFVPPLVNWLNTISHLPVHVAASGAYPSAGNIYFAPSKTHLRMSMDHHFELSDSPRDVPHIPSGDVFLESVAKHYGSQALGIVLTGMGNDGARGLKAMYDAGAITVAQDSESCVVFGMPQEAITLGGVRQTLNPSAITKLLLQYSY